MKNLLRITLFILTTAALAPARDLDALKLLYVGDRGTSREATFTSFLKKNVQSIEVADRRGFDPASAAAYDVVLLDWPQGPETRDMRHLISPLGRREKWGKPTVLLGSAGLNLAVSWQLKGGVGCTCMDSLAYGLRDHDVFEKPFTIDRSGMVRMPTPLDFQAEIKEQYIRVLPLVDDPTATWRPGWCTYANDFARYPDVEYFCGGVNHKTPTAAGLWRQGNLLHFGFEQSPAEMNVTGQQLLLNSIAYISRFSQDRPIAFTPSVFAGKVAQSHEWILRHLRDPSYRLDWIEEAFSPELLPQLSGKSRAEIIAWAELNLRILSPNRGRGLEFDEDLRSLDVSFDLPEFLNVVVQQLNGTPDEHRRGWRLVERYLPDLDPAAATTVVAAWVKENRPYLFASDSGDYRWYIDPLAKRRGIPTCELRGPLRADVFAAAAGQ